MSKLLTTREVCDLLDLSSATVTRMADRGDLGEVIRTPGRGKGFGHRRFRPEAVEAYRKSRESTPCEQDLNSVLGIKFG
jgi:excisionase family DNA binding protein